MQSYSPFFETLHDERKPVGYLGRGTHYSVLKIPVWHDRKSQSTPELSYQTLAIIWDEDHDTRIMNVIHRMHSKGLLFPVLFVGERKGGLTVILDDESFLWLSNKNLLQNYKDDIEKLAQGLIQDSWNSEVIDFSSMRFPIISDSDENVELYLRNIKMLWGLDIKPWTSSPAEDVLIDYGLKDLI